MIAAMAVGAGIAVARVAYDIGLTVSVIGTPAEEVGNDSGKIRLLERGAFDGVHTAMMVHPCVSELWAHERQTNDSNLRVFNELRL
jgi:metal-dependent amidase/aminoacylase/carboxypeptidase family protein